MADLFVAKLRSSELRSRLQNFDRYLSPVEVAPVYEMAYSTFQKYLKMRVRKGGYQRGAFRVNPQYEDSPNREYSLIGIHPTLGLEDLDRFFGISVEW